MTTFINLNAVPCPDLLPNAPFATGAADNQAGLHLSYSFGTSPGGYVGIRADGTAANPTRLKNGDFIAVYGSGGYNGGGTNHGYTLGSAAVSMWADEDWSPAGTGTFVSIDTRTRGVPGDNLLALHRIHITSDGITINDANGSEPSGGRLGAGTLNVASTVAINGSPILTGPSLFTPADASGAGLAAFTAVSVDWYRIGNLIFFYVSLTYPATGSGLVAAITLPVAVPNIGYAAAPGSVISNGGPAGLILQANPNTATASFRVTPGGGVTNAALNLAVISFMLIYPVA
jgi:hypothetical protein